MTDNEVSKKFDDGEIELSIENINDCVGLAKEASKIVIKDLKMFEDLMNGKSLSPSITKDKIATAIDVATAMGKISSGSAEERERWNVLADFLMKLMESSGKKEEPNPWR